MSDQHAWELFGSGPQVDGFTIETRHGGIVRLEVEDLADMARIRKTFDGDVFDPSHKDRLPSPLVVPEADGSVRLRHATGNLRRKRKKMRLFPGYPGLADFYLPQYVGP